MPQVLFAHTQIAQGFLKISILYHFSQDGHKTCIFASPPLQLKALAAESKSVFVVRLSNLRYALANVQPLNIQKVNIQGLIRPNSSL